MFNLFKKTVKAEKLRNLGDLFLRDSEVWIVAIVKGGTPIYVNKGTKQIFEVDRDGDEKLDGRVCNFIFSGNGSSEEVQVFVAFDDGDSYGTFMMGQANESRLGFVCNDIYKSLSAQFSKQVFSKPQYKTQYEYVFKMYRRDGRVFLVNSSQTKAMIITDDEFKHGKADPMKGLFFG